MVTLLGPIEALGEIVTMIETLVEDADVIVAVTPDLLKVTAVAPARFVPVIVAGKLAPVPAAAGLIDEIVGATVWVTAMLSSAQYSSELSPLAVSCRSKVRVAVDAPAVKISTGFPVP
jgi:hypothetical protein